MSVNAFLAASKAVHDAMEKKDEAAKKTGALLGRYLSEPYADGSAYYEIVEDMGPDVRVRVITGVGDDWRLPQWGDETIIPREYAEGRVASRDNWNRVVAEHQRAKKPVQAFAKKVEALLPGLLPGATSVKVHGEAHDDGMDLEVEYQDGEPAAEAEATVRRVLADLPGGLALRNLRVRRSWFSRWGRQFIVAEEARTGKQIDHDAVAIPPRPQEHARIEGAIRKSMSTLFPKPKKDPFSEYRDPFEIEVLPGGGGPLAIVTWENGPEEAVAAAAIGNPGAHLILNRKRDWVSLAGEHLSPGKQG